MAKRKRTAAAAATEKNPEGTRTSAIEEAEAIAAEAIGDVINFWGFREILGRVWAILYLSPEPLSAKQIRERLDASVGNTSMALTELRKWGVVKKVWNPGERQNRFAAEVDVWRMISNVLAARERGLLVSVRDRLEQCVSILRDERRKGESVGVRIERAQRLLSLTVTAQTILDSFIATRRFDASAIGNVLAIPGSFFRRRR